jgi:hypothetical protein
MMWLWQVLSRTCRSLLLKDMNMPVIDIPVRVVVNIDDESDSTMQFLAKIIQSDGTLRVTVCPSCFSLVPFNKLSEHHEKLGH